MPVDVRQRTWAERGRLTSAFCHRRAPADVSRRTRNFTAADVVTGAANRVTRAFGGRRPSGRAPHPEVEPLPVDRVEVSFQLHHYEDGQPFIALAFTRDGAPVNAGGRLFTFDLNADTPRLEAETIVHLLRRKLTHFVMTTPESPPLPDGES